MKETTRLTTIKVGELFQLKEGGERYAKGKWGRARVVTGPKEGHHVYVDSNTPVYRVTQ